MRDNEIGEGSVDDLLDLAGRVLAGATLGMFRLPDEVATVFERGEGSRIFDVAGREYIDYVMGSGPLILGHAPPPVVAAVREQAGLGSTFSGLNEPALHLAERILEAAPCGELLRFTSSGTEGSFAALRLARAFTGREQVLKFEGGWHGAHDYAQQSASSPGPSAYPVPTTDSGGIPAAVSRTVLVSPFNETRAAVELIHRHGQDLAAVIVEPLQRAIPPEPGFLAALREATRACGAVLVFDEVVTGFRIAWGGAQERYGVVPDLAVDGKTVSGGYPLAAVCGRAEVMRCADPGRKGSPDFAFISGTTNGNPVGAVAGLATLRELAREGVYDQLHQISARFRQGLEALGRDLGFALQVIGDGPVLEAAFTAEPIRTYADGLRADANLGERFGVELVRRGIFVNPGKKFYLSLAHTPEDVDETLTRAEDALRALR